MAGFAGFLEEVLALAWVAALSRQNGCGNECGQCKEEYGFETFFHGWDTSVCLVSPDVFAAGF
jgi:hypothetical protein